MIDTKIELYYDNGHGLVDHNTARAKFKEMKSWLQNNNVKYSLEFSPTWSELPCTISMSSENALAFKLRYGL